MTEKLTVDELRSADPDKVSRLVEFGPTWVQAGSRRPPRLSPRTQTPLKREEPGNDRRVAEVRLDVSSGRRALLVVPGHGCDTRRYRRESNRQLPLLSERPPGKQLRARGSSTNH